jgi:hypothetical protein
VITFPIEMGHGVNNDDAEALRWQLVERLDAHPMEEWSPALLRAVIDVIDLGTQGFPVPPKGLGRAALTLVK